MHPPSRAPFGPVSMCGLYAWTSHQTCTQPKNQPIVQENMLANDSGQFAAHRKQNLAQTPSSLVFSEFQDRGAIFRKGVEWKQVA